jgi:hypothetical protein
LEFSPLVIVGLFFVALIAGLVDAIAGGGGLLTVPALMATGMPTEMVFGTNKGSAVFGSGAALLRFWRARLVDTKRARLLFPLGMIGSFLGAALLLALDKNILRPLVLVLLVVAGFVVAFVRPPPTHASTPPKNAGLKTAILALVIGAYDGFFGPGTGTFLIIGFVVLLHLSLQEASANAKVVNFASNLAAMLILTWKGLVIWKLSIPMAAGQFIGGTIGAQLAVKGGDTLVRRVVLVVVLALVSKLGYELMHTT